MAVTFINPKIKTFTYPGQVEYIIPGTYNFIPAKGVTSVSVVCIGAGGNVAGGRKGSGGGGLGWKNNIPVTPGQSYTVVVGEAKRSTVNGNSYFINVTTVAGFGGIANVGGSYFGDGGGYGGNAGGEDLSDVFMGSGGGGAGGYSGDGGAGGFASSIGAATNGSNGTGGGAGGGGGASQAIRGGGSGGGVSIYGEGSSGTGGAKSSTNPIGGTGGSAGANGANGSPGGRGGLYGGGMGGYTGTLSGNGAVRIIWGENRAFPSSNTGNF